MGNTQEKHIIWSVVWNILSIYWEFHHPNCSSLHHFSEGWAQPPTSCVILSNQRLGDDRHGLVILAQFAQIKSKQSHSNFTKVDN